MENWIYVKGTDDKYMISDLGRIKPFKCSKTKILRLGIDKHGYFKVCLITNKIRRHIHLHQLMAICFLNHKPCGINKVVDHIDGDKLNNKLTNLQVISNGDNIRKQKKRTNTLSKYVGVQYVKENSWRTTVQIDNIQYRLGTFKTQEEGYETRKKFLIERTNNF